MFQSFCTLLFGTLVIANYCKEYHLKFLKKPPKTLKIFVCYYFKSFTSSFGIGFPSSRAFKFGVKTRNWSAKKHSFKHYTNCLLTSCSGCFLIRCVGTVSNCKNVVVDFGLKSFFFNIYPTICIRKIVSVFGCSAQRFNTRAWWANMQEIILQSLTINNLKVNFTLISLS